MTDDKPMNERFASRGEAHIALNRQIKSIRNQLLQMFQVTEATIQRFGEDPELRVFQAEIRQTLDALDHMRSPDFLDRLPENMGPDDPRF